MKFSATAISAILLLSASPTLAQTQDSEPEPSATMLCFQIEVVFVRALDQAEEVKEAYNRICSVPPGDATCYQTLRESHGDELNRLYRYRRWGNALRQEYGNMCGGALNDTLNSIVDTLDYVTAN